MATSQLNESEESEPRVTEIESYCVNCQQNGTTRLLLINVPHFKEVILSSFECPHCSYSNREVQSGASLAPKGSRWTFNVSDPSYLNRQVIKSEYATLRIEEIDFEVPPNTLKGACNTIEGILTKAADGLSELQPQRLAQTLEVGLAVQKIIEKLRSYASGEGLPFTLTLDDPSGNSFVERGGGTLSQDPSLSLHLYQRSKEQSHAMGFYETTADGDSSREGDAEKAVSKMPAPQGVAFREGIKIGSHLPNHLKASGWDLALSVEENIARVNGKAEKAEGSDLSTGLSFDVSCPHCGQGGVNNMCEIDIPGFKKCIVMAFHCSNCGAKSNEVKPSGAYGEKARKWTLEVTETDDLNRDVLKSDTAAVSIPELDFEMCMGTLGGVFTTVEGLILKVADSLEQSGTMSTGDSAPAATRKMFTSAISSLRQLVDTSTDGGGITKPFTLILDDAADLSFISSRGSAHTVINQTDDATELLDKNLHSETYERTHEQNDDLGLADMKTEDY